MAAFKKRFRSLCAAETRDVGRFTGRRRNSVALQDFAGIIYASPASWMRFSVVARRRRFVIQALQNRAFLHFSAGGKMTVRICACT
jgi:hypothetical protein